MTMHSEKLGMSVQDKLTKQNEMNRQILVRELSKLEEMRKSDVRMMETAKQRFRSRYKKLGARANSSSSEAIDVRMYETHNPGFCYHFTGAIKESGPGSLKTTREDSIDSYEVVHGMLFTDGEVDIDKVLCLHLLAAHTISEHIETQVCSMGTSFSHKANKEKCFNGAWNNILPCYVIEHNIDDLTQSSSKEYNRKLIIDDETLTNFQLSYERYVKENTDIVTALTNDRSTIMAPKNSSKMPIISPHVYSLLGASHELKVKQTIAEDNSSKRYKNDKLSKNIIDTDFYDVKSITDFFRLLERKTIESKSIMNDDESKKNSNDLSKINSFTKNHSKKSLIDKNNKFDRSITMLKKKSKKSFDEIPKIWRTYETFDNEDKNDLVTIKSSQRKIVNTSNASSTKSAFKISRDRNYSINSIDSFNDDNSRYIEMMKKNRKYIYLDKSVENFLNENRKYKIVEIFVNYKIQKLVNSVLDVIRQVNPSKFKRIIDITKDRKKIGEIFEKSIVKKFIDNLVDQPIVSSSKNFVLSNAIAVDEFDTKIESFFVTDLIVATSLDLPDNRNLTILFDEIKNNIFINGKNRFSGINESSTIDTPIDDRNTREDSTIYIENQRNEMPIAIDDSTIDDRDLSMKFKTMNIVAANKSSEDNRGIDFDKYEFKHEDEHFNKIIDNSMSNDDFNDKSVTKIGKSSGMEKYQFKGQKMNQEGYLDPDRVILRRMTNEQRILVGRVCAELKNKKINNEGLIKERTPLAALITPVLSRESIKILTRGTSYSKSGVTKKHEKEDEKKEEQTVARSDSLTGPLLAKVRRDIAEHETKRRLESFFAM